jgi:hypothetical protein
MPIAFKGEFLVSRSGEPKGVLLPIAEYRRLLRLFEDMEDALDLKRAVRTNKRFISHERLKSRLKRRGLL